MADIPLLILFGLIAIPILVVALGAYLGKRENNSIYTGLMLFISAGLWVTLFIATDRIIIDYANGEIDNISIDIVGGVDTVSYQLKHQQDTGNTDLTLRNGATTFVIETPNSGSSILIGSSADTIELNLKKTNSPTGTVIICAFGISGSCNYQFGSIDVSTLTTSYVKHNFTNFGQDNVLTQTERLGIYYNGGDITNNIQVQYQNTDVFDTTNTIKGTATGSLGSATFSFQTGEELRFRLFDSTTTTEGTEQQNYTYQDIEPIYYDFSTEIKYMYLVIAAMTTLIAASSVSTGRSSGGFKPFDKL